MGRRDENQTGRRRHPLGPGPAALVRLQYNLLPHLRSSTEGATANVTEDIAVAVANLGLPKLEIPNTVQDSQD